MTERASEAVRNVMEWDTFTVAASLLAAFVIGHFINTAKIRNIPQSTASIFVGICVGYIRSLFTSTPSLAVAFDPDFFYFFLLPPIILEAGFSLDRPNFINNIYAILFHAIFGTLVCAAVVAQGSYLCADYIGLQGSNAEVKAYSWMLGALISAVDPVATLSILGGSKFESNDRLFAIVFGESILNDAVSVVLFRIVEQISRTSIRTSVENLSQVHEEPISMLLVSIEFIKVVFGSFVVGGLAGALASVAFRASKKLRRFPEYEVGLLVLLSYFAFVVAELLKFSGILALFLTGIMLGRYNLHNMSPTSQRCSHLIFKVLVVLSESFIYILLGGVAVASFMDPRDFSVHFVFVVFSLCLISRGFVVFPSSLIFNAIWRRHDAQMTRQQNNNQSGLSSSPQTVNTQQIQKPNSYLAEGLHTVERFSETSQAPVSCTSQVSRPDMYLQSNPFDFASPKRLSRINEIPKTETPAVIIEEDSFFSRQSKGRKIEAVGIISGTDYFKHFTIITDPEKTPTPASVNSIFYNSTMTNNVCLNIPTVGSRSQLTYGSLANPFDSTTSFGIVNNFNQISSQNATCSSLFKPNGSYHSTTAMSQTSSTEHQNVEEQSEIIILKDEIKLGEYLDLPCQIILWMSGLRGAFAFAMAMSLPSNTDNPVSVHNKNLIEMTTFSVVFLSTVCLGSCIEFFALRLGILRFSAERIGSMDLNTPLNPTDDQDERFSNNHGWKTTDRINNSDSFLRISDSSEQIGQTSTGEISICKSDESLDETESSHEPRMRPYSTGDRPVVIEGRKSPAKYLSFSRRIQSATDGCHQNEQMDKNNLREIGSSKTPNNYYEDSLLGTVSRFDRDFVQTWLGGPENSRRTSKRRAASARKVDRTSDLSSF